MWTDLRAGLRGLGFAGGRDEAGLAVAVLRKAALTRSPTHLHISSQISRLVTVALSVMPAAGVLAGELGCRCGVLQAAAMQHEGWQWVCTMT